MQLNPTSKTTFYISIAICLGTFVSAYLSVNISQIAFLLKAKYALTDPQFIFQLTLSTSAFNLGNIIGPLGQKKIVQFCQGHRHSLILLDSLTIILLVFQLYQLHYLYFTISRLLMGLCVGISSTIVPSYIKGITPKQIRGSMGTFNQLLQTVGVLVCYFGGFWLLGLANDDQVIWRLFLGFPALILLVRIIALGNLYPYDSLVYQYQSDQIILHQYLNQVYLKPEAALQQLQNEINSSKYIQKQTSTQLNKSLYTKKMSISIVLMISNQATGINVIVFYTKQLFEDILRIEGDLKLNQYLLVLLALFQVFATLLSTVTIQIFGRKKLLQFGQLLIIGILVGIGITNYLDNKIFVITLIFIQILVHNWSLGPACIIYAADLLPDLTYIIMALKVSSFVVALTTEYFAHYIGLSITFFSYAMVSSICFIYLNQNIIETKGLSQVELNEKLLDQIRRDKKD